MKCISEDPSTSSLYRVIGHCVFRDIPNLSVREGVVPHVIKLVLRSLHKEIILGVQDVFHALALFTFGQKKPSSHV